MTGLCCRPSCHNCGEGGHVGGDCKRHVPPGVRNERNPHYRAPPTAALYDDGYVTAAICFSRLLTIESLWCWHVTFQDITRQLSSCVGCVGTSRVWTKHGAFINFPAMTLRSLNIAGAFISTCYSLMPMTARQRRDSPCSFPPWLSNCWASLTVLVPPCAGASIRLVAWLPSSATHAGSTATCPATAPCKAAAAVVAAAVVVAGAVTLAVVLDTLRGIAHRRRMPPGAAAAAAVETEATVAEVAGARATAVAVEGRGVAATGGVAAAVGVGAGTIRPPGGRARDDDDCSHALPDCHLRGGSLSGYPWDATKPWCLTAILKATQCSTVSWRSLVTLVLHACGAPHQQLCPHRAHHGAQVTIATGFEHSES